MKHGPVTKLNKRNTATKTTTTTKKIGNNFFSANYDFIIIFPIYGQFGEFQKPDDGISLIAIIHLTKTKKQIKKSLKKFSYYCLE